MMLDQINDCFYEMSFETLSPEQKQIILRVLNMLYYQAEKGMVIDRNMFSIMEHFFLRKYPDH